MADETTYRFGDSEWAVSVEADRSFKSGVVKFNGFVVGTWSSPRDLSPPLEVSLSDSSRLTLRRVRVRGLRYDLDIRRDGIPLTGSAYDPRRKVADAAGFLLFMAALTGLLGFVALTAAPATGGADFPYAIGSLMVAAILLGLGIRARKGSIPALGAAIGLVTLNALAEAKASPGTSGLGYLVGALLLIALLARGIVGARQVKRLESLTRDSLRG